MSETTQSKKTVKRLNGETNKNADKTYTDPVTGKFVPGNPGGGRPPGTRNFSTDFDEVVQEIADVNKISFSEARKILLRKAYAEARNGSFNFWNSIMDRYYGKAEEFITADITHRPIYGGLSRRNGDAPDIPIEKENPSS